MFDKIPTYDKYRTLSLQDPLLRGEDVYALQKALTTIGFPCSADGVLGNMTLAVIRKAQQSMGLTVDGKAGGVTQKSLAMVIAVRHAAIEEVPSDAMRGQLEHESGFRLGIYSPPRDDGHYDAGVAQRNTKFTPAKDGFNPNPSIQALAQNTRKHFDLFAGVKPLNRRWGLAQGAWNAPAFACYLAREEGATKVTGGMTLRPSAASRVTFEAYIQNVSQYLTV